MREFRGQYNNASGLRVAICAAEFNDTIVNLLVKGCRETLERHGVSEENISLTRVPGAFELPVVAQRWAQSGSCDVVICLGTVIRGATSHYDFVAGQAASGIQSAAINTGIPIIFGVLTTDTIDQAIERSGTKAGNKGSEAAMAAIEMADVMQQIPAGASVHTLS